MREKRPLVWLSAANRHTSLKRELGTTWALATLDPEKPVPIRIPAQAGAKIGILDLAGLSGSQLPSLEHWLEGLGVTYWVGLVAQRPANGSRCARVIAEYCCDFHTLPVDVSRLNAELGHLWGMAAIREPQTTPPSDNYLSLVLNGESRAIREARTLLRRFSATLEPVLVTGESGTGKEAAAHFVHQHSVRASGPLVTVNCAALPPSLTQSELFGYEKGAFTHALSTRKGRLEQANGGSLILSAIDELLPDQQSAILRFLQEGQIERVGGHSPIRINSRIITTSNRPLRELIESGQFRSDVYYRLGGLEVKLPALRDRREDIPALAESILAHAQRDGSPKQLSETAAWALVNYSWPGNFRELQSRLRQGALLSDRPVIEAGDLDLSGGDSGSTPASNLSLEEFRARADRQALSCSLALAHQNISEAARILKISRVSFYRLMGRYDDAPPAGLSRSEQHNKGGLS